MSALSELLREPDAVDWPAELGDYLSASRLAMFERCPELYRRVYVLGERRRPAAALVWGGADHEAHELNFRQKIESHQDLAVADVEVAFAEAFDRKAGEDDVDWGDDKPGDLKDKGVALVAAYHRQVSPTVQPLAVEERFKVTVPGVPVPVIGYMDVRGFVAGERRAIERKTSKAKVSTPKPDWRIQGLLYQAVAQIPVDWHVSVKTKLPAVYTPREEAALSLALDPRMSLATIRMVANTARAMVAYWTMFGPDQPWPGALTHPWSCGFCGFRDSCAWWGAA